MLKTIVINPARLSIPPQKPAFIDFRVGGTIHEYSIPNTRAFLDWLGVRVTHHVWRGWGEHFRIHGLGKHHSIDDACIAELIRIAGSVEFRPNPEDLAIMLRYIALQDKTWGYGFIDHKAKYHRPRPTMQRRSGKGGIATFATAGGESIRPNPITRMFCDARNRAPRAPAKAAGLGIYSQELHSVFAAFIQVLKV